MGLDQLTFVKSCRQFGILSKCDHFNLYRWLFQMYDKDCSGTIELSEMTEVIQTLYAMEGSTTDDEGVSRATR